MNLSANFTLAELTASDYALRHGLSNQPTDADVMENLHVLAQCLERVRELLGNRPIFVNSAYRGPKLNSAIGGSKTSAHMKGLAADIRVAGLDPREVCQIVAPRVQDLGIDQLIYEGTWTHIGLPDVDKGARGQVLTAVFKSGGPTRYVAGIV